MVLKFKSFISFVQKILYILTKRQKALLIIVMVSSVFSAMLQTLSVSIIAPLVSAMMGSQELMDSRIISLVFSWFDIKTSLEVFLFLGTITIFLYIVKNIFCIFQLWINAKFSNKVLRELSISLLKGYMCRDYDFFLNYGTAKIIRDIFTDTQGVYVILVSSTTIITEMLTIVFILAYIVASDYTMALCIAVLAVVCLVIIYKVFKQKMKRNGEVARRYTAETNKIVIQAVEGIKEVQVMRKQNFFIRSFSDAYANQLRPNIIALVGGAAPTYVVEGIFVSGIMAFICIRMITDPGYAAALPLLASFLMGAVRMLPSLGRISSNLNTISYYTPSLQSVYDNIRILKTEHIYSEHYDEKSSPDLANEADTVKSNFKNELVLDNVSWHYKDNDKYVLRNLSMTVRKGQSVGIIGSSGAGKSTLADIILGLHIPQEGAVKLDGINIGEMPEEYSRVIGFVPQSIYLVDGSVRENVAFGISVPEINDEQVWRSLERAQLAEFVHGLDEGLDTVLGERGIRFSGGQRQRIAIARALYREPELLVLDEATSALDNETETEVMEAIEDLYGTITMIIIAHRLTTVRQCDVIYEIAGGKARAVEKAELFDIGK